MDLFSPIKIGNFPLRNRIFMAPMTRCRSIADNVPNQNMAEYYAQRASAGLIITEATQISPRGVGYPYTPGIHTPAQVEGWKNVTQAVHERGGRIFLQLWHVGRISHPAFHQGAFPFAPSAIKPAGSIYTPEGMKEFVTPHALSIGEIKTVVEQYVQGAKNAIEAGFDGVEIHGANGYLIDQFLRDGTNVRDDVYGGSVENRARFLFEIIEGIISAIGSDKTGVRLSPSGTFNDMKDSDPERHFSYICEKLNGYNLAYLHIIDALEGDIRHGANVVELSILRKAYNGILIANGGYTQERGNTAIESGLADAVAFGALFLANPDLPERFAQKGPFNEPDPDTFYTQGEEGYLDYPTL
ncbi:alkene reductase [Sulfuricurvum sp.]|uniref:alkene reductase n=1 Tax=Sulfuricurvum sp. TaxID=2025608 RepID=UPI0025E92CE1|nr:alkene reductase [Sulfuricurvum sp.]